MRKTTPMKFGDLWNDYLKESPNVARKLAEAKIVSVWPAVVGPYVASHTKSLSIKNGILTAYLHSASARSELFMQRDALRDTLNNTVGQKIINTVIIK